MDSLLGFGQDLVTPCPPPGCADVQNRCPFLPTQNAGSGDGSRAVVSVYPDGIKDPSGRTKVQVGINASVSHVVGLFPWWCVIPECMTWMLITKKIKS